MSAHTLDLDTLFTQPLGPEEASPSPPRQGAFSDTEGTPVMPVPADGPKPLFRHRVHGEPTKPWAYNDARGQLLGYVCRFDRPDGGKEILPYTCWRNRAGQLEWRRKWWPEPRPLYGLDQLAARPDAPVIVTEGEKAADAAALIFPDAVATTSPSGAYAANKADWSPLRDRRVLIAPDANDAPDPQGRIPGEVYARDVAAQALRHGAAEVLVLDTAALSRMLPDGSTREGPAGWDIADALGEGWDPQLLRREAEARTAPWRTSEQAHAEDTSDPDPLDDITTDPALKAAIRRLAALKPGDYALQRKAEAKRLNLSVAALDSFVQQLKNGGESEADHTRAQRDILLELAQEAELWRCPAGEAYASVVEGGCRKNYRIGSGDLRSWLIRCWMEHFSAGGLASAPGSQGLQDAINALGAKALLGPVHTPFVRIGHLDGCIYIDLGDDTWRAVEIDVQGWRVVSEAPVRFTRPSGLLPLPEPVRAPDGLTALHSILPNGAGAKDARTLLLSFLVGVFMPHGSLPLLALSGRQGSGKSTLTRRFRDLIDPNQAPARQQPRSEDDLIIAARNGALVAFDNLSHISAELSDALCRLATGAGFSKRRLYTDGDEIIVQVRRPVIINGITDLVRMPDLADRALFVDLPTRSSFAPEAELERAFAGNRPAILALLYDAVSAALRGYSGERASPGIRLADFERWVRAAGPVLGLEPAEISSVLAENRVMGDRMLIEDDIVASAIQSMLVHRTSFRATATDLLNQLREAVDEGDIRLLPKGPRALSAHLKRFVPAFERLGIVLEQTRVGQDRQRLWLIRDTKKTVVEEF